MNLIQDHIEYLKNNPEGYWFKRKLYGYGWTPARKEGWFLTALFIITIITGAFYIETRPDLLVENSSRVFIFFGAIIVLFLVIVWKTGEPLKWQWGIKKEGEENE